MTSENFSKLITLKDAYLKAEKEKEELLKKLKLLNERLTIISELGFDGIFVHKDGEFISANHEFLKMTGFSSFEELSKVNGYDILIPEDRDRIRQIIKENIQHKYKATILTKQGDKLPVICRGKEVEYNGYGKVRVAIIIKDDER